ncbi:RNA-directed DNA polymerase, eukaryota, reverse transcriptase zinc-binding domain protein [Tanacetum coccineum]
MIVKIGCWNIRGLLQTSKEDEVKLFIREECLSMCAIVETRLRKKSVNTVCERLSMAGFGLLMQWRAGKVYGAHGFSRIVVYSGYVSGLIGYGSVFVGLFSGSGSWECNKVYIIDKGYG